MRAAFGLIAPMLGVVGGLLAVAGWCEAAEGRLGLLIPAAAVDQAGMEGKAAWELAQRLGRAELILVPADGRFVDAQGRQVDLKGYSILWYHEGDTAGQTTLMLPQSFPRLRQYVSQGGGLLLSGAALSLVHTMGVEPISPRRMDRGKDAYVARITPARRHPIFDGLVAGPVGEGPISLTSAGYPACADFHGTGGPSTGMVLAHADSAQEEPVVEYQHGKGRILAIGWRLAHYSDAANQHRANLERLTGNAVAYLGDPSKWQKVEIHRKAAAQTAPLEKQMEALGRAIDDLIENEGPRYQKGEEYRKRLSNLREEHGRLPAGASADEVAALSEKFEILKRESMLDNPVMRFERLLYIERSAANLGLPANWESNSSLPTSGFDNRIRAISPTRADAESQTVYEPGGGRFVGDLRLHFDADRLLFSMPGSNGRWQVHELTLEGGKGAREIQLIHEPDVDNYDACYLPDGRLIFSSTAPWIGVPCVYGGSHITNLYLREREGSIRQLTVDQEHNWCPTVLNDGRVLYLRWEYTDLPHSNSRRLFHMNPDGTAQMAYMSSNSYFPNSFFYAKPIPGHASKVVGIATGHHGNARMGRFLVVDSARGQHEAEPVVQEIPGYGKKVEAITRDTLADGVWPQFLHPYPLSEKYFLVSARLSPSTGWGIYLVDKFDNMLLLKETPGYALLEPTPLIRRPTPPVIHDRVDPARKDALVYLADITRGPGLAGVPAGAVKKLRLVTYHFSYRGMGGLLGSIGMDGPWDIKRVLGTVPVEPDGSAYFRVPANVPISIQPLDEEGKALQLMRSWFTAMPGETVSCVGCHEQPRAAVAVRPGVAAARKPSEIEPWRGPLRGFAFHREVQPVLDRHCVSCHNGQASASGTGIPDLRGDRKITDWNTSYAGRVDASVGGKFSVAYAQLHRYVRRPGIESDIHLLTPMEFHADTTELVQLLRQGHYGVKLDEEAWDRLVTWIDLNAPYHGTWSEIVGADVVRPVAARKRELYRRYAGVDDDPEAIISSTGPVAAMPVPAMEAPPEKPEPVAAGWPFDALEAKRRQGEQAVRRLDLGGGVGMDLVRIPAGAFVMGEGPARRMVRIERPFWIGRCEVTNAQYARFDAAHDSHVETMHGYQFGVHGFPVNRPNQPVVRVSWSQSRAFCEWLSRAGGRKAELPSEEQWEYACRAGAATAFHFGGLEADFSKFANVADRKLKQFSVETYVSVRTIPDPTPYDDWIPRDDRFDDGGLVSVDVGSYQPNAWGLHDMHGNVAEWTTAGGGEPVARGGSWYDRPGRCTSASRLAYRPYQPVFNVGFRVVLQEDR